MPLPAQYLVDTAAKPILLRIEGYATYLNCAPVEKFLNGILSNGTGGLQIDFAHCTGMDSTFLGLLAGAATRLKTRKTTLKIRMLNLTGRNRELFRTLGIAAFFDIAENAPANTNDTARSIGENAPVDRATLITAHTQLIAANPENARKFQSVVDFLSQQAAAEQ